MTKWRMAGLCLALILASGSTELQAQARPAVFDATRLAVPRDLDDGWLAQPGDSASYAEPGFDDSTWAAFDLHRSLSAFLHGAHPPIVWYRVRLRVDPAQTGIALREETLARAFEIYVNGERLMASGQVAPLRPYTYNAPILVRIPDRMVATGHLVVAVRAGIAKEEWGLEFPGLSTGNLTLGPDGALADKDWLEVIGENFGSMVDSVTTVALGLVALALFLSQRRHREYLWIFGLGMVSLAELPVRVISLFHNIPIGWRFLNAGFTIFLPFLTAAMYFAFVSVRIGRKFRVFLWIAGLLNAYSNLANQGLLPNLPGSYGLLTNLLFVALLAAVIPIVLGVHLRRGNREAGILLIPAIAFSLYIYANYALALLFNIPGWSAAARRGLNLIQRFPAGPFAISLNDVSGILSTIALSIIMVLRASRTSRVQAQLEGELEAAREVQQVILPEQIELVPGFAIESVYVPAQQVGGDFFQIVPIAGGGLLLVIGDVAGKGLPAAMLVSVVVGAIRATAEFTHNPQEILASLNERLLGRSRGGFSTALAAYFSPDGFVEIANAGHLSPYIDGQELDLEGALPLGILSRSAFPVRRVLLPEGSRVTFYSDGVVEAQNGEGELFGFDRSQKIATHPATEIAAAAKHFGQSDDITVVAITRTTPVAIHVAA
ncbi:PP2C family protein-serine/threonine phosphatase [Granulicella sibirica]|nr:SpoIIE family protein phosphatase [Granulicella sibirica]